MLRGIRLSVIILYVALISGYAECLYSEFPYAECPYAQCSYAECPYAECPYAECPYAEFNYAERHYDECCGANFIKKSFIAFKFKSNKTNIF